MPSDIAENLETDGFVKLNRYLPLTSSMEAFSELGRLIQLPGVAEIQLLTPRQTFDASPNTYSGNFGVQSFPLHTDLAHWFLPPRYFALRCVVGSRNVSTNLVDTQDLISIVGRKGLMRALVRPRRPLQHRLPLLRLLSTHDDGCEMFRWDSLFVEPATPTSLVVCQSVSIFLESVEPTAIQLENLGDTLIIDNWRMLHGRSRVSPSGQQRKIQRAYFGGVH